MIKKVKAIPILRRRIGKYFVRKVPSWVTALWGRLASFFPCKLYPQPYARYWIRMKEGIQKREWVRFEPGAWARYDRIKQINESNVRIFLRLVWVIFFEWRLLVSFCRVEQCLPVLQLMVNHRNLLTVVFLQCYNKMSDKIEQIIKSLFAE